MEEFNEDITTFCPSPKSYELIEKPEIKSIVRRKKKKTVSKKLLIKNILIEKDLSTLTERQRILNEKFRSSLGGLDDISLINSGIDLVPYNINNKMSLEGIERKLEDNCTNNSDKVKGSAKGTKEKMMNRGGMISDSKAGGLKKRRKVDSQVKLSRTYYNKLYEDSIGSSNLDTLSRKHIIKLDKITSYDDIYIIRIPMWIDKTKEETDIQSQLPSMEKNTFVENDVEEKSTSVDNEEICKIRLKRANFENFIFRFKIENSKKEEKKSEELTFIKTPLSTIKEDELCLKKEDEVNNLEIEDTIHTYEEVFEIQHHDKLLENINNESEVPLEDAFCKNESINIQPEEMFISELEEEIAVLNENITLDEMDDSLNIQDQFSNVEKQPTDVICFETLNRSEENVHSFEDRTETLELVCVNEIPFDRNEESVGVYDENTEVKIDNVDNCPTANENQIMSIEENTVLDEAGVMTLEDSENAQEDYTLAEEESKLPEVNCIEVYKECVVVDQVNSLIVKEEIEILEKECQIAEEERNVLQEDCAILEKEIKADQDDCQIVVREESQILEKEECVIEIEECGIEKEECNSAQINHPILDEKLVVDQDYIDTDEDILITQENCVKKGEDTIVDSNILESPPPDNHPQMIEDISHTFANRNCFTKFSLYLEIIQMYLKIHKCHHSKSLVDSLRLIFEKINNLQCMCDIEQEIITLLENIEECKNCG